jgi:hypothetical protein
MYGKLFSSIYSGTLHGKWEAIVTLQQLVILADGGGVVDMVPHAISGITSIPLEIICKGLEQLSAADPEARHRIQRNGYIKCLAPVGYEVVGFNLLIGNKRPSQGEWAALRTMVFERDDYTCQYCGQRGGKLECDHVHPVSRGGSNELDNLTTACLSCNRSKRDKTLAEWMQ